MQVCRWTLLCFDSTCVLIGQQVCFHTNIKHENDVKNMVGCLQVVRIYSFMKEIKLYIHDSYIVFLFVKSGNDNVKRIRTFWPCLYTLIKTSAKFVRVVEQVRVFSDLLSNSPKLSPQFTKKIFYLLIEQQV